MLIYVNRFHTFFLLIRAYLYKNSCKFYSNINLPILIHWNIIIMNTAQVILFLTLILSVSCDICDAPGECTDSIYITNEPAIDSFDCWKKCRSHQRCYFGTFRPEKTECLLFETCTKLDTTSCPNCRTSSIECVQCDFPGLCFVSMST